MQGLPDDPPTEFIHRADAARLPSVEAAARLVGLLRAEDREPIDDLLETLLLGSTAEAVLRGAPDADPPGAGGSGTLSGLDAAKLRARHAFEAAPTRAGRDAALLRYLLAVAEGVTRHDANLSSLPGDELADWLRLAAEGLGEAEAAVASLLGEAARRVEQTEGLP